VHNSINANPLTRRLPDNGDNTRRDTTRIDPAGNQDGLVADQHG
jgi:hypothetical protein